MTSSYGAMTVYPRECGGTGAAGKARGFKKGLSPRVRGNLSMKPKTWTAYRSIPASAGEPLRVEWDNTELKVYPRECGGTQDLLVTVYTAQGLSPRVRGNRFY